MNLTLGQNTPITASTLNISLLGKNTPLGLSLDTSIFLLNAQQKVAKDDDFVFFNNPNRADIGLVHSIDKQETRVDLSKLPNTIEKIVFTLTISDGVSKNQAFKDIPAVQLNIKNAQTNIELVQFKLNTVSCLETALIIGELYRRNGAWKFRAVGQGFKGGLQPLAELYGVDIGEGENNQAAPVSETKITPSKPKPSPRKSNSPINLQKAGEKATISLVKGAKVTARLKWETQADLDLYCFYVDDSGHEDKVYYRKLGSLNQSPYIQLMGDSLAAGEEIVEISKPEKLSYALIAAYSALSNGTGSFHSYQAKCVITDNQGQTITTHLANDDPYSYWVALARIDFSTPHQLTIENVESYSNKKRFLKEFEQRTGTKVGGLFRSAKADINGVKSYDAERSPYLFKDGSFMMSVGVREFKT